MLDKLNKDNWKVQTKLVVSKKTIFFAQLLAILFALFVSSIVIKLSGLNPLLLGAKALNSTLGSFFGLEQLGILLTPILITAVAAATAFRMGLWNIGIEGQFYLGAIAVTLVGLNIEGPNFLILIILVIVGIIGGALWALLPALAKAYANISEIISTLMLNFIAILLVNYLAIGPLRDKTGAGVMASSARISYSLPEWFGALHIGFFFALIILGIYAIVSFYTQFSYETEMIGANSKVGPYIGVSASKRIILIMLISGGIAGLAGMVEITGNIHRLQDGISNQFGIFGIIVAVLSRGSPLGILIGSVFIALVLNSGIVLQSVGLSVNSVLFLTGLILLAVTCSEVLVRYKLVYISQNINLIKKTNND
ncbi:MAG TPA: ABC transporter permease [Gammaproteobacteria bacterium]|jgi:simple sugar transport system permease protein|nr:ABC transporter permease [Gammaproteobacteria bacterium]